MTATHFVDTNVLLYAGSNAAEDQAKKAVARQILSQHGIGLSAQVLQEFYSAAVSKKRLGLTSQEALAVIQGLAAFPTCPVERDLVLRAIELKDRYDINYWDAAIIAAAKVLACGTVYTEDLNDGQDYDGVRVVNSFASVASP